MTIQRRWLLWAEPPDEPCLCLAACARAFPIDGSDQHIIATIGSFSPTNLDCRLMSPYSWYVNNVTFGTITGTHSLNFDESIGGLRCAVIGTWSGKVYEAAEACGGAFTSVTGEVWIGFECSFSGGGSPALSNASFYLVHHGGGIDFEFQIESRGGESTFNNETGVMTLGDWTFKTDPAHHVYCPKHTEYRLVEYVDGDLVACAGCTNATTEPVWDATFVNGAGAPHTSTCYYIPDVFAKINGKRLDISGTIIELLDAGLETCRYRMTIKCVGATIWQGEKNPGGCDPRGTFTRTAGCDTTPSLEVEYVP